MKLKIAFVLASVSIAAPAMAGTVVPAPEAGAGLASMALLSAAYLYLRKRTSRG